MQDQQGFDDSDKLEIVQFNYRPLHVRSEIKRRPTLKPQESWQVTRDSNRGQWAHSIVMKEPQSVVFSSDPQQVVLPEAQLQFQADFQSSNLELVTRRRFLEYELYMRPDTNTDSHYQWFYFKAKNLKGSKLVTFTIKNFVKRGMLYNNGLKPFYRKGDKGQYQQLEAQVKFTENIAEDNFSLKFCFQFQKEGEKVEFCSQPPYTYSKMLSFISEKNCQSKILCRSTLGKKVPYLIFNDQKSPKAVVIAIARQHPGQSVGSWMMDGVIRKLSEEKSNVLWYVVPMLCVDGVILGNNRTGMPGYDFNRCWNVEEMTRKQKMFPQIVGVLNLVKQVKRLHHKKPKIFLDLHGHSSQPNIFTYGPPHDPSTDNFMLSRAFPELLSEKNNNFNIQQCSYMINPDKKNTVRSIILSQHLIPFVYTIQASFGIMRGRNVNEEEYVQFGIDLVGVTAQFMLKYALGEKNAQTFVLFQKIRQRGQQVQAIQYDSDDQRDKSKEKRGLATTQRGIRNRMATDHQINHHKQSIQNPLLQLAKVEETIQQRYMRPLERKRTHTEVGLSKLPKSNFLPKLKQSVHKKKVKEEEEKDNTLMNLKEIQKRLNRLKNCRVGKKILVLNSYGV